MVFNMNLISSRISKVQNAMNEDGLDVLILLKQSNIFYLSNVYFKHPGTAVVIVPKKGSSCVLTLKHELFRAEDESLIEDVIGVDDRGNLFKAAFKFIEKLAEKSNIGIEEGYISHYVFKLISNHFSSSTLRPASYILDDLRQKKSSEEIHLIRRACKLADIAVNKAIEVAREGVSEVEIAAKAEAAMRLAGASDRSFRSIVSSGVRTSYTHGWATEKRLETGDLVMFDIGAFYKGYFSDLTRMGRVGEISGEKRQIVETVVNIYRKLLDSLKPGVRVCDIVSQALRSIKEKGFRKHLLHNLGRGIGLELFEKPYLTLKSNETLKQGMVIAISPALFVKGKYGARVEGMVLLKDSGCEPLNGMNPELKNLELLSS